MSGAAFLEISGLRKAYPRSGPFFGRRPAGTWALAGVDLQVARGECLALVGESGSGKTTLARCVLRILDPTAGRIYLGGEDLTALRGPALRRQRRRFQLVFQDPAGSLDPRQRVRSILAEPLRLHEKLRGDGLAGRVEELLAGVGLASDKGGRFPHQLSGGERQRVGIARALASRPELLVADEPVSALDMSLRGQVLELIAELQKEHRLTLLLISHDLAAVERLADRIAVLYLGRVVEIGPTRDVLSRPLHPYTRSLLAAAPSAVPRRGAGRRAPSSTSADAAAKSSKMETEGCPFLPRCPQARDRCRTERPELQDVIEGREAACFYPGEGSPVPPP